jgi:general L-amino acid transport system substrate-binding protein
MRRALAITAYAAAVLCCIALGSMPVAAQTSKTLDTVRAHGVLTCGVSGNSAGFSLPDSQGVMRGIDADECRAVAAAVFGDPSKVKWVVLTVLQRFTGLQSGEVDVLFANATWTMTRETKLGLEFASIYYYDGQAFMVKKALGVTSAKQLDGATICMLPGATSEIASQEYFSANKMKFTPVVIAEGAELRAAFIAGRCDAYFTDASALAGFRATQGDHADDYVILPELISNEPLGGAVRKGDEKWFDVVRWTHFAMVTAEMYGITSKNADSFLDSKDPKVRRLLGQGGDFGQSLGLDDKWAYNVIKTVGNFGEVWDRNVVGVPRGLNRLWTEGGLQYAPPIR